MENILIVCTGNTCRSAMAEAVVKDILAQQGRLDQFNVVSRGVAAFEGQPASDNAIIACNLAEIDLTKHRAKRIALEDLEAADRIYAMSEGHREAITSVCPGCAEKIKVLDLNDPYGLGLDEYQLCLESLTNYFKKEFGQDNGQ